MLRGRKKWVPGNTLAGAKDPIGITLRIPVVNAFTHYKQMCKSQEQKP